MRASRSRILIAILVQAAFVFALLVVACATPPSPPTPPVSSGDETSGTTTVTALPSVEVTSYKGKKLDQVDASLRENSIKGPQEIDRTNYRLHIVGLVQRPMELTYEQVTSRPSFKKVVTLNCVEGWSSTLLWQGVLVRDLLKQAGVKPQGKVVIFKAVDGYTDSYPVDYFTKRDILLGYLQNGQPLKSKWGWPFQLVAEDKWGYKWVKWIDTIEVSSDTTYRGYWEQRGYSNDGGLDKSFLGK